MEETIQPAEAVVEAMPEVLPLAADFAAATREQWEEQVVRTLNRGRPEDRRLDLDQCLDRLRTRTVEGLVVEPLYTGSDTGNYSGEVTELGEPGRAPFRRGSRPGTGEQDSWDVRALHDDPDADITREAVLTDLERGVTSLWLRVGTGAIATEDLDRVLTGVELDLAPVVLSSEEDQLGAAHALLQVCRDRGTALAPGSNLGLDPVALAAVTGAPVDLSGLGALVEQAREHPGTRALTVDATVFHDAGAADVDELALAVATGVAYLRALEGQGVPPAQAADQLEFRVSATADQFLTIARLRALRVLWARVAQACGIPEQQRGARQHAVTSWRMLTRDDPWVNLLRATTATFAAAAGGAEAITVLPHDHVHGYPDAFSRRVARNTQVVLAEESNIGRVSDPAGGSWYVEALTDQLATAAWVLFQRIEAAGGIAEALAGAVVSVEDILGASRAERERRIADRSAAITGVSSFPATAEVPLDRRARPPRPDGGLASRRDAETYEALRDRSAAHQEAHGSPPTVLVAALGTRRDFGARETFTTSLLAAGGVRAHLLEGAEALGVDALAAALRETGSTVAILCSSPARYAEGGLDLARALREAGAGPVLLAGSAAELGEPGELDEPAEPGERDEGTAPVDGTVHAGMDVVAFLDGLLDILTDGRPDPLTDDHTEADQ